MCFTDWPVAQELVVFTTYFGVTVGKHHLLLTRFGVDSAELPVTIYSKVQLRLFRIQTRNWWDVKKNAPQRLLEIADGPTRT